jgi:hypothetical protein
MEGREWTIMIFLENNYNKTETKCYCNVKIHSNKSLVN